MKEIDNEMIKILDNIDLLKNNLDNLHDKLDDSIDKVYDKLFNTRELLIKLLDELNELITDKSTVDLKEIYFKVVSIYEETL